MQNDVFEPQNEVCRFWQNRTRRGFEPQVRQIVKNTDMGRRSGEACESFGVCKRLVFFLACFDYI